MDEVAQLIETFRARARSSARSKLDALLDLERFEAPRVLRFLLEVLLDQTELKPVRIHVLKRLRNGNFPPINRPAIAEVMLRVLFADSGLDLRVQAALALAQFADIEGVPTRLGRLALDPDETIDLRFSALTSLQCQRSRGSPQWRPRDLPVGGHEMLPAGGHEISPEPRVRMGVSDHLLWGGDRRAPPARHTPGRVHPGQRGGRSTGSQRNIADRDNAPRTPGTHRPWSAVVIAVEPTEAESGDGAATPSGGRPRRRSVVYRPGGTHARTQRRLLSFRHRYTTRFQAA
jgi:hypothetical protein